VWNENVRYLFYFLYRYEDLSLTLRAKRRRGSCVGIFGPERDKVRGGVQKTT
jgi:hypothetical protein